MNQSIKWIDEVRGTDSMRGAARRAEITAAKLIRQVNDDQLTFETVRDVSRAYGRSVLADLVTMGMLTPGDVGVEGLERALQSASDEQLVLEVGRRLDVTPTSMLFDTPVDVAVERAGNVTPLRQNPKESHDELAAASERSDDLGEDTDFD